MTSTPRLSHASTVPCSTGFILAAANGVLRVDDAGIPMERKKRKGGGNWDGVVVVLGCAVIFMENALTLEVEVGSWRRTRERKEKKQLQGSTWASFQAPKSRVS
jgi:hypothetical protein